MVEKPIIALGLMSGTSMDGVDAALVETDGVEVVALGPTLSVPYTPEFRARLAAEVENAGQSSVPEPDQTVIDDLTRIHCDVSQQLLTDAQPLGHWAKPEVVGFHGHTIVHRPDQRMTLQIGDASMLSTLLAAPVVADFRTADVAEGGQGAPLAPIYHAAMLKKADKPVAVVNIGGVSNVTWIGCNANDLIAFDTGPGNALIDEWVERRTGQLFDKDGQIASQGTVDQSVLNVALDNPFFEKPWPKSLDRLDFSLDQFQDLSLEDGAASLVEFTAETILLGLSQCPTPPRQIFISGGGRHNKTLMQRLAQKSPVPLESVDALGWDGDFVEAQAFAYMAVRALREMPITFPGTTGIHKPRTGGSLFNG